MTIHRQESFKLNISLVWSVSVFLTNLLGLLIEIFGTRAALFVLELASYGLKVRTEPFASWKLEILNGSRLSSHRKRLSRSTRAPADYQQKPLKLSEPILGPNGIKSDCTPTKVIMQRDRHRNTHGNWTKWPRLFAERFRPLALCTRKQFLVKSFADLQIHGSAVFWSSHRASLVSTL